MNYVKVFLSAVFVFVLSVTAFADDPINVTVAGERVNFTDQHPVVVDGRTLVPMRGVFEHLGFEVDWDGDARSAILTREDFEVIITLDSNVFTANGISHNLEVPAQSINGRTMLPIRAVLESVGYNVGWDEAANSVLVNAEPPQVLPYEPWVRGEPAGPGVTIATVNGLEIGANDIIFRMMEAGFMVQNNETEPENPEDALREEMVRLAAIDALFAQYAEENGIELTEKEIEEIGFAIQEWIELYGEEEFIQMLRMDGIESFEHLDRFMHINAIINKVIMSIIEDPEKFAPFEQFMEEMLGAKHILISAEEYGDEEAAMKFAQEIRERAVAGEDFDALMETYSEDPGKESLPQGYTFTAGVMVPEFEQGTRDLEIGEISEPIRSHFGFHIILRIEPNLEDLMSSSPLEESMSQAVYKGFEAKVENAEIIFLPELSDVPVN
ncbi:MAG: stalk domain-containing protein [Defluviitaleaceae bacterium]|nr:stalk domain-containing protein [Defluviitaleaceae bacterium]